MSHTPGMKKAKTPAECPVVNLTDVAAQLKRKGKKPYTVCFYDIYYYGRRSRHHTYCGTDVTGSRGFATVQYPNAGGRFCVVWYHGTVHRKYVCLLLYLLSAF